MLIYLLPFEMHTKITVFLTRSVKAAFYLLYLFSHAMTKRQFFNKILIDTTLPNIGDRWRELLLPNTRNATERERIKRKLRDAFLRKWEIQREFETIKKTLV